MTTILNNENNFSVDNLYEICVIWVNKNNFRTPLLTYPPNIADNAEKMRPIDIHSIWFLSEKEKDSKEYYNLEYGDRIYYAKKVELDLKKNNKENLNYFDSNQRLIVFVSVPIKITNFGADFLLKIENALQLNLINKLSHVIESSVAQFELIKTPKIKKAIERGEIIKESIRQILKKNADEFFSSIIEQFDATSLDKYKALSFLMLKNLNVTHIISHDNKGKSSLIKIRAAVVQKNHNLKVKCPVNVLNVRFDDANHELEILVKNLTNLKIINLNVKLTLVKDFFEKDILNENVEFYPEEEIVFISPIIPQRNEYIYLSIENGGNILFSKIINLHTFELT